VGLVDLLGAFRRRWYLALLGLILTGALGYGAIAMNPPSYTARGLVLLLPSQASLRTTPNPLLGLVGLDLPGRVVTAYYSSADAKADLKRMAPSADISVYVDDSTGGPVIAVDVKDTTPENTIEALNYVVDSIPVQLARIQRQVGATEANSVRSAPLIVDSKAQATYRDQIRIVIAAVGAGLVLTVVVVFAIDGVVMRRRRQIDQLADSVGSPVNDPDAMSAIGGAPEAGQDKRSDSRSSAGSALAEATSSEGSSLGGHRDPSARDAPDRLSTSLSGG
jgi:hypothetical protein